MTKTKKAIDKKSDEVPTLISNPVVEQTWSPNEPVRYVVTRDGHRVSEREYVSEGDTSALSEWNFWNKISTEWSDGTKVLIVPFDKKEHRIW
jgi:hypothetical protein